MYVNNCRGAVEVNSLGANSLDSLHQHIVTDQSESKLLSSVSYAEGKSKK